MNQSIETNRTELAKDHSRVQRPPEYYQTRLRRSNLELIQVVAELDLIDEIPAWKKIGMMIFRGKRYDELRARQERLTNDKAILRKRKEMATDLMNGDTTYHSEAGFDGFETVHDLKYVDLTAEEDTRVDGQDTTVDIGRADPQALESVN